VEKIPVIHSSGSVYYHYYPFFLSKLTKEGKTPKLRVAAKPARCERPFVCKKKRSWALSQPKPTQSLLDFCLVYRKNVMPTSHPNQRSHPASALQASKTSSTVDKVLYIHSTRCAEQPFFLLAGFLSNIGSASIQCLSSRFVIA
jgi:hypothetical protein